MPKVTTIPKEQLENCPVRQVLSQVTGKWQMLIVLTLADGGMRFGALKRTVGDITQRVLTENLRKLERDGYLTRTVEAGPPVSVTYELTEMGHELHDLLIPFMQWAAKRHEDVLAAREKYEEG